MPAKWPVFLSLGGLLAVSVLAGHAAQQPAAKNETPPAHVDEGRKIFERHCALCHGMEGKGRRGPALNRAKLTHAPDDEALKSVIAEGIAPNMPEAWFLNDEEIANAAAFVRSLSKVPADAVPGDATRGAGVYAKRGCSACHILDGAGRGYGPELTGIGERRSASFLEQAIRKPASSLPDDFLFVKATTSSGAIVEGIRVNEDSFTIQIKDPGGRYHSFRKAELRDLQKRRGETPMPSFGGALSDAELQDLVAYLAAERAKP